MGWFAWGFLAGSVLFAVTGVVVAWLGYLRLVTAERRARESERLAELGSLTSGLTHELKNPLSTIQLNLQLLSEDLDPRDLQQSRMIHRMEIVQRETSRLREILEDFLRFAGKMELHRKPTDLNDLLEELVDFFLPQAQLQKVQLRLKREPGPLLAEVDAKFIKQAVLNLMINAVQAMPEGGELILSARRQDGFARIDIIDTGAGIPPETLKNIFMAYYSTKRSGTGLGLAISQRIAKEHGGSLNVDTAMGKGSDFYLLLPTNPPI
jgi:signal transduction histidine kinase